MPGEIITSKQNPLVKYLVKLSDRKVRDQEERFLVEGYREIQYALRGEVWIESLFYCPALFKGPDQQALVNDAIEHEVECVEFAPEAFRKISLREGPDGLMALAVKRLFLLEGASFPRDPMVLVVEGVEKPGNLGAICRSAEAAGVDALICSDPVTDIFNPHVIRNSQGLIFTLPVFVESSEKTIAFLKENGIHLFCTTPDATTPVWDADLSGPTALVMGSESKGLPETWLAAADERILIPMQGEADSLNVSVSAAICVFEAARQRR